MRNISDSFYFDVCSKKVSTRLTSSLYFWTVISLNAHNIFVNLRFIKSCEVES